MYPIVKYSGVVTEKYKKYVEDIELYSSEAFFMERSIFFSIRLESDDNWIHYGFDHHYYKDKNLYEYGRPILTEQEIVDLLVNVVIRELDRCDRKSTLEITFSGWTKRYRIDPEEEIDNPFD